MIQWKLHLFELEAELKIDPLIKYVIYQVCYFLYIKKRWQLIKKVQFLIYLDQIKRILNYIVSFLIILLRTNSCKNMFDS